MKNVSSRKIFGKKNLNIRFHENLFSGSGGVSCGRWAGQKYSPVMKLIVAFPNSANVSKIGKGKVHPCAGTEALYRALRPTGGVNNSTLS